MKNIAIYIRRFLFFLIVVILVAPNIQSRLNLIKLDSLNGAIVKTDDSSFSFKGWFSGEYQLRQEKYLNESFGFRSLCIQLIISLLLVYLIKLRLIVW